MPIDSYRVIDETPSMTGGEIIGTPVAPPNDATRRDAVPADGALLVVSVPAGAKVFVNGDQTTSGGEVRRFLSRGLEAGRQYEFVVKMAVDVGGSTKEETKVVRLTAGERSSVAFADRQAPAALATTSLTLRVPSDAKVFLAGNATSSSGSVRQFETSSLKPGQTWKDYEIRVVTVVDGEAKVARKVIDLAAGSTVELALDPTVQVASAQATAKL